MTNKGVIGEIVETKRIRAEELWVEWKIRDFLSLSSRRSDFYVSPGFLFDHERWFMSLCLNCPVGVLIPESEWVRLCLYRQEDEEDPNETLTVGVALKGSKGMFRERAVEWEFSDDMGWNGYADFCLRSELSRQNFRLMPDGHLIITCVMKSLAAREMEGAMDGVLVRTANCGTRKRQRTGGKRTEAKKRRYSATSDESSQRDNNVETEVFTEVKQSSVKKGGEKANEDYSKLLASGEHSDLTVQVGEVEFIVHKAILSARSPVLSAMLQGKTSGMMSNKIVIEDCEPDIFKDFLHYIYVGSIQLWTERNVFSLYRVAKKFLSDDLKLQCLERLEDALCLQTFCDTLKFALTHEENDLLEHVVDFATKNIRLIIRSVEWQNFFREFPTEANEILVQSLGPPSYF